MIFINKNSLNKAWLPLCLIFIANVTFAQKHDTVVIRNMYVEASKTVYRDINKSLSTVKKGIQKSKQIKWKKGIANGQAYMGIFLNTQGRQNKAIPYLDSAFIYYKKYNNLHGIALIQSEYALIEKAKGNHEKAIEKYLIALDIYKQKNKLKDLAITLSKIGNIYRQINSWEKALEYFSKALEIKKTLPDEMSLSISHLNIGGLLLDLKRFDEALIHLEEALRIQNSHESNYPMIIAKCKNNIGNIYIQTNQIKKGLKLELEAIEIYEEIGDTLSLIEGWALVGQGYFWSGNYKEAINAYTNGLKLANSIHQKQMLSTLYTGLADSYYKSGGLKKAYDFRKKAHELDTALLNIESQKIVNELEKKYKVEKEQKQNQLLTEQLRNKKLEISKEKQENAISDLKISNQKNIILFLILGVFLISIISLLILRNKNAKEKQKTTELEHKALRSQMNPHFIFNSLNSIQHLYLEHKEEMANEYMANFSILLRNILEKSDQKVISLQEELNILEQFLEIEQMRTSELINYTFNIDQSLDLTYIKVPPLILQPFVENAIWHGILPTKKPGDIIITLEDQAKNVFCKIEDDGIGIDNSKPNNIHQSKGIEIAEQRLGGKGTVKITPRSKGGTLVEIKIKKSFD